MRINLGHPTALAALGWIGALVGGGGILWACQQTIPETRTSGTASLALLDPKPDTGIELRAAMLQDTVGTRGYAPVWVVYAIVNGPRPTVLHNEPDRFGIVVLGPDGQPAKSLGGAGPAVGLGPRFDMPLPSNGLLVQRQNLRCVNDAGYSTVPLPASKDTCLAMYALTTPGRYRVVVEYFGPDVWRNLDSVIAARDRGEARTGMDRPLRQGVHLVDTATFVVVER